MVLFEFSAGRYCNCCLGQRAGISVSAPSSKFGAGRMAPAAGRAMARGHRHDLGGSRGGLPQRHRRRKPPRRPCGCEKRPEPLPHRRLGRQRSLRCPTAHPGRGSWMPCPQTRRALTDTQAAIARRRAGLDEACKARMPVGQAAGNSPEPKPRALASSAQVAVSAISPKTGTVSSSQSEDNHAKLNLSPGSELDVRGKVRRVPSDRIYRPGGGMGAWRAPHGSLGAFQRRGA